MIRDLVLDTSAVVALFRGVYGILELMEETERLWLPLIALGELEFGVENSSRPTAQRAALDDFLGNVELLHLTAQTSRVYARVRRALAKDGSPIPENDVWIAAQAIEHGWQLATLDSHFDRVEGLRLRA